MFGLKKFLLLSNLLLYSLFRFNLKSNRLQNISCYNLLCHQLNHHKDKDNTQMNLEILFIVFEFYFFQTLTYKNLLGYIHNIHR